MSGTAGRLFVLGAGRAGLGVACAAREAGGSLAGVHGRRAFAGDPPVTAGLIPASVADATVILVAVRDGQIDAALRELAEAPLAAGAAVLQASGSAEPDFAVLRSLGHPCGTFHPLVPLARPERAASLLRGAWVGVDGDEDAIAAARRLAALVGAHVLQIPRGERARYHAAAVFASNFPTVLAGIAESLLAGAGVSAEEARGAVRELLRSAAANVAEGDTAAALTGPVARGDAMTVARHVAALRAPEDGRALRVYLALTAAALEMASAAGTSPAALATIEGVLRAAEATREPSAAQSPVSAD